jgi:hypothetical protein
VTEIYKGDDYASKFAAKAEEASTGRLRQMTGSFTSR